mmetsp:Transcript_4493/g.10063  ORF Transcript_4493/g.10063 Transcript_4493/m.10063 type:complete len:226 (-) Transcript_4493:266-943(-)
MITPSIILCFAIICETCTYSHSHPNPAFANRHFSLKKVSFNNNKVLPKFATSSDTAIDAMLDAEEATAIDAHDISMIEKSILAATNKLELCQEKATQTEYEVKAALEEKYEAKTLIESIERERRAAEMRFLSTEHYDDDDEVRERLRDSSVMHADAGLLAGALEREHEAELRLEKAIEDGIAAKRELERMIDSKVTLKQELRGLEELVHERSLSFWEEEKKDKKF